MAEHSDIYIETKIPEQIIIDPEIIKLQKIFGDNATISKEDELYKVDTVLKDAISSGGQRIQVTLHAPEKTGPDEASFYDAKEFLVDGTPVSSIFGLGILFKFVPDSDREKDKSEIMSHLWKFKGTKAYTGDALIVSTNLEDADGLTAIFHEIGHTRDDRTLIGELNVGLVSGFLQRKHNLLNRLLDKVFNKDSVPEDVHQAAEEILDEEMFANRMGVKAILHLRKKGFDMFKNDESLDRVKKFLVTTTMTRFRDSPKFIELVGRNRLNEILNL